LVAQVGVFSSFGVPVELALAATFGAALAGAAFGGAGAGAGANLAVRLC
jgi:hypothetical protein